LSRLPIRLRVTAAFAAAMALVLAGTSWLLYSRVASHLTTALERNLSVRAQDLQALVSQPHASLASDTGSRFIEHGESYAQLVTAGGRVLDATSPLGQAPLLTSAELRQALREPIFAGRDRVPGLDEPSKLMATPLKRSGRRLVLIVGLTRQDRDETLSSLRDELLVAGPIALLLASLAGYGLAGLSLRPIEAMRRRAEVISAEFPDDRLPVPSTRDEVERLAETLNEMLARLEAALQREREFVADAAHELRTPLALLKTELELAGRQATSLEDYREAIRASSQEVQRLVQLAEDLLVVARSDQGRLPLRLERLSASQLLGSAANRFVWRAEEERRALVVDAPADLRLMGDRLRLEQALANLVDNALRYGTGEVGLSAAAANGAVELHVTDEGAGFPADFLDRAFARLTRADHARGGGGFGLGLSIVRVIAEAHGGSAHARNRNRGADVWIVLPAGNEADPAQTQ
jgi:two-component system OmpR family sensor kinase